MCLRVGGGTEKEFILQCGRGVSEDQNINIKMYGSLTKCSCKTKNFNFSRKIKPKIQSNPYFTLGRGCLKVVGDLMSHGV